MICFCYVGGVAGVLSCIVAGVDSSAIMDLVELQVLESLVYVFNVLFMLWVLLPAVVELLVVLMFIILY